MVGGGPHLCQRGLVAVLLARAVEPPGLVEGEADAGLGDADEGDKSAEAAGLEGAAREPDEVDLVAGLVVLDEGLVGLLDAVVDADADAALHELQRLALGGDDAFDVVGDLLHAIGIGGGNDLMQLADVGEDRTRAVVVPGAVEAQDDALHETPQLERQGAYGACRQPGLARAGHLMLRAIATVTGRAEIGCVSRLFGRTSKSSCARPTAARALSGGASARSMREAARVGVCAADPSKMPRRAIVRKMTIRARIRSRRCAPRRSA